jgi:cytochrome c553
MSRHHVLAAALLAIAGLPVAGVRAEGDAARGAELATTCLGCHGIPGYRNAYPSYRVPMLGGQNQEYVVLALQGYRNKQRAHPTMQAQATTLSDEDMRDLAAFFAAQGKPRAGAAAASGSAARGGEKAAACAACHGEAGVSPAPAWPNLAGQHKDYLIHALVQYQNGQRKDPVMAGQVGTLTERDISDLAAFFAAQPGLFTADQAVARQ